MKRISYIVVVAVLCAIPAAAGAATLYVSPSDGVYEIGQSFRLTIMVNSQGTAINASEGTLSFNPALLAVENISSAGSIFNINVQQPEYSNSAGTAHWAGITLNPGYRGATGNLVTVQMRALASGTAAVQIHSGSVLANDGTGSEVLTAQNGGTYTIVPSTTASGSQQSVVELRLRSLGYWALLAVILILLFLILCLFAFGGKEKKSGSSVVSALLEDIDGELLMLTNLSKHRELNGDEKYYRSKLLSYRTMVSKMSHTTSGRLAK